MRNGSRALIATGAVLAASVGTIVGCGGGSGPPSAVSILQGNGYTQVSLASLGSSASDLSSSFPAGSVSSYAIGDKGSEYQFVIVVTAQGQSDIASTDNIAGEESAVAATGASMTYSGDVVTITGTPEQFSNISS